MSLKVIVLFLISASLVTVSSTSFLIDETSNDIKLSFPDPRFPKLLSAISNRSEYYENEFSYQYYFDDGKLASEVLTLKNITRPNEQPNSDNEDEYAPISPKEVTIAVGQGFFRFVVKQNIYSFKYDTSEIGIQGELSYSIANGTLITEYLKSAFNEFTWSHQPLEESEKFRVSHRRFPYDGGQFYNVNFQFANNTERGGFECDFETNTEQQYYFTCRDPNEVINYEWIQRSNECDENGHYKFNYTSDIDQVYETGEISEKFNISSGLILIPNRNGLVKVEYVTDFTGTNVTWYYPFNNGTVAVYYYPESFMPEAQHSYINVEAERELLKLNGKSVIKSNIELHFLGPNGSGEEHITWIHKYDIDGEALQYSLSGVAPTLQVLKSLLG